MDKYPGIVSSLRYLSNNIKTRIVDDREKRFTKINKHISQAQDSITRKVKTIIKGLKSFDNPSLTTSYGISTINMKQSIIKSMQKTLTIHINHGNR